MIKSQKIIKIAGEAVNAEVFQDTAGNEWTRLTISGSWYGPQNTNKCTTAMAIDTAVDGSFTVTVQKLILLENASDIDTLEAQMDDTLNKIEDELGLAQDTLSSSSWWVGTSDTDYDYLMTKEEQLQVEATGENELLVPNLTISSLISLLQNCQKQHGDLKVTFYSDEWTDDLEECKDQKRWFRTIQKQGAELQILLDR